MVVTAPRANQPSSVETERAGTTAGLFRCSSTGSPTRSAGLIPPALFTSSTNLTTGMVAEIGLDRGGHISRGQALLRVSSSLSHFCAGSSSNLCWSEERDTLKLHVAPGGLHRVSLGGTCRKEVSSRCRLEKPIDWRISCLLRGMLGVADALEIHVLAGSKNLITLCCAGGEEMAAVMRVEEPKNWGGIRVGAGRIDCIIANTLEIHVLTGSKNLITLCRAGGKEMSTIMRVEESENWLRS